MHILDAIEDPKVFASAFRDPDSWKAWRAFLSVLFGLPLDQTGLRLFRKCTGRRTVPKHSADEAWLICGRGGGKSFTLSLIATYLACFRDWKSHLGPGEVGTIMIVASDRKQARVCFRFIKGLLKSTPMLAQVIKAERSESIELKNRIVIEVHTASFRTVRGYSICAALLDEVAFWSTDDAAEPDTEIINAVRPGLGRVPGSILLCASSPHARRGALWEAYQRHYGKDGDPVLLWRAGTRTMNPTFRQSVIDAAMEKDPAKNAAEYFAEFRTDVESFIAREIVEAAIDPGVYERPPMPGITYTAFVDPSGGSSDSFTLAIAHRERDLAILDAVREVRPPFSPESVTAEFATFLKTYRVSSVVGDRYGGEWPRERFLVHGINYKLADKAKSDIYLHTLPMLNSRKVVLLDNAKLVNQLCGLERRTVRGGRDKIDHADHQHDDLCNAVAGALVELSDPHSAYVKGLLENVSTASDRASNRISLRGGNAWHSPHIPMSGVGWHAKLGR